MNSIARQEDRHERVDVLDGIPREPTEHQGGGVALLEGRIAMRVLVRDDREQQHRHEEQQILKVQRRLLRNWWLDARRVHTEGPDGRRAIGRNVVTAPRCVKALSLP